MPVRTGRSARRDAGRCRECAHPQDCNHARAKIESNAINRTCGIEINRNDAQTRRPWIDQLLHADGQAHDFSLSLT